MKRILFVLPWILVIILGGIVVSQFRSKDHIDSTPTPRSSTSASSNQTLGEVANSGVVAITRVIDGDTIEITGRRQLRYIGIDTSERGDCFGAESTQKNKELVEGKTVRLEKDVSETDRYGRLLRYVWVEDVMVNEELVRSGFASVSTYPPDVKYVERFRALEQEAREANRGLWDPNVCTIQGASSFSQSSNPPVAQPSCSIKGNISTSGEKIYHVPGCGSYNKTVIDEGSGERFFCTEEEAVAAGWRRAKNCP